ncbi:unnamed protein product [Ectocarpus sp. CCAP 1310/34]|nr:unnamed protein product [Ectocarpus sp. CCAP 1310/34]
MHRECILRHPFGLISPDSLLS